MKLMPGTARELGGDPARKYRRRSRVILHAMIKRLGTAGGPIAYNAGPRNREGLDAGRADAPQETRAARPGRHKRSPNRVLVKVGPVAVM
jgi:hypothetical protein